MILSVFSGRSQSRNTAIAFLAVAASTILLAPMAHASDAEILRQTVRGVNAQTSDSTALLRGETSAAPRTDVEVNCQTYEGGEFVDLDCADSNGNTEAISTVRWHSGEEILLSPIGNSSDGLSATDSSFTGEIRLYP